MKTTMILQVILTTIVMTIKMGSSIDLQAENKFFDEFNGFNEIYYNFTGQIPYAQNFDAEEWAYLKQNILNSQYAGDQTNYHIFYECRKVVDKLATNGNSTLRQVQSLCVTATVYEVQTIGFRRSRYSANRVYVFSYNPAWFYRYRMNQWPLIVIDLVQLPYRMVAPAAK